MMYEDCIVIIILYHNRITMLNQAPVLNIMRQILSVSLYPWTTLNSFMYQGLNHIANSVDGTCMIIL